MKKIIASLIVFVSILSLTACGSKYDIDVNLSPEEKQAIEADIVKQKDAIKNYNAEDGSIPVPEVTYLAADYEKLGKMNEAIKLYRSWLDQGHKTAAMINNLGRLYEKVGEVELAVTQYKRLIDEYYEDEYLYDITWAYINANKRKEAEKFFNLWQLKFQKTDLQTQEAIKKLREGEQKAE